MYVCVCMAVPQSEVEKAIQGGATTREAVTRVCGAGSDCGACHGMIRTMIEEHGETAPPVRSCPPPDASAERLVPETTLVRTRAA